MARVLIVGCGCRGRELVAPLAEAGHAVRGTTRDAARLADIEAAGAEAALADPDRLGTVLAAIEGVSVVVWLLGNATGPGAAEAHGPRLETMLERLVDTPVRGFVYEVGEFEDGTRLVREAEERWRLPVALAEADPADLGTWRDAVTAAVAGLLR